MKNLTKSKLMNGLQCPKRLYLEVNHPELKPKIDAETQARFDQGTAVGALARDWVPGGSLVKSPAFRPDEAVRETRALIDGGALVVYEGGFTADGVHVRADILSRKKAGARWDLQEVKDSTRVKDQHLDDLAIQDYVLQRSGVEVDRLFLVHINGEFVHPNGGELFVREDVTDQVRSRSDLVPGWITRLKAVVAADEIPGVDIGAHCQAPYECPFSERCRDEKGLPDPSVLEIPRLGDKKWLLYKEGIVRLDDPRLPELTGVGQRMVDAAKTGRSFIDRKGLEASVLSWKWPLYFLDFESLNPAIPLWEGTKPYEHVPVQFSCHVQLTPGGQVLHQEYLHESADDPRHRIAEKLVKALGTKGAVVSYYMAFESGCLERLARWCPEFADRLLAIRDRLVDPLPIIREHVYHPAFAGSFSLKKVAPALLGQDFDYGEMDVGSGGVAQVAYAEMVASGTHAERRREIAEQLREYCKKDTLCLVHLVEWMHGQGQSE